MLVSAFSSSIVGARQCQLVAVNVNFLRFKAEPEMGSNLSLKEKDRRSLSGPGMRPHSLFTRTCDRRNRGRLDWVRLGIAFKKAGFCILSDINVLYEMSVYV